jgi:hypothetical protein
MSNVIPPGALEAPGVSWLNRGSDSCMSEVRFGCKRLLLKLSEVLISEEVEEPYMHLNQRLVLIQK